MGVTEHRTLLSLWRDKCGIEDHFVAMTEDIQRGVDNEDRVLEMYCERIGLKFFPLTLQHEYFGFLRASLDGANPENKRFCEIKCPRPYIHKKSKDFGAVKDEYYWQIQHQYLVSEYTYCDFISFDVEAEDLVYFHVPPDPDHMAELLDREILFWEYVMTRTEPDPKEFGYFNKAIETNLSSICF